ncbi:MAG: D-2-hydroxyacid dehydrogenase family protein [Chloroflexi bacterium]|nr:D-2-hydroxyacid dehydrogenase family protein [Chloroflexota bacterium]
MNISILDDYQGVSRQFAEWSELPPGMDLQIFQDHLADEDALVERLATSHIVMGMRERTPFPRSLLERLPDLRLLVTSGAGNASFDLRAATELGIVVCGTGGSGEGPTELTWGLIIGMLRKIPQEDQATRQGSWGTTVGIGLQGKTLGLLGLGRIGSKVARVANAFDMNVIAWSQNLTAERAAECQATLVDQETLYQESDIVSVHLRLSDRTRGLVGASQLALMKPTSYIVNISRGPIIDESALIEVLRRHSIAGAAIDTFDVEPLPPENPLLGMSNVLLTPHIGYVTEEAYRAFYGGLVADVRAFVSGEPIRVLNPDVLESSQMRGPAE